MSGEKAKRKADRNTEAFAVVGELVMLSTALDHLVNNVLITVLALGTAPMLEPVVATLDPSRKIEILRARAGHMPDNDWKRGVTKFCDKADSVFKQRNIACHTPPLNVNGTWSFTPVAAAKLLKRINLTTKKSEPVHLNDFKAAISTGEAALGAGVELIENYQRLNAEIATRDTSSAISPAAEQTS